MPPRLSTRALHAVGRGRAPRIPISPFSTSRVPGPPRHLLSIADLTATELSTLIRTARAHKHAVKSGHGVPLALRDALAGQTVAVTFNKRSTRTRVSTEGAVAMMGGHPMFLGKDDIQLGVNESLRDTAIVLSSMSSAVVARVGPHSDVESLAAHSSVPVINALSDIYHPLQTIADFLTLHEAFPASAASPSPGQPGLGLEGLRVAWVGDATNVLFDLALGAAKLGVHVAAATPRGYPIPPMIVEGVKAAAAASPTPGGLSHTDVPEEAIRGADVVVTDTWVSMGQEAEKAARLQAFDGYRVTEELARRAGAKEQWVFLHCLPRKQEEVDDEVFYGPRSLVFPEAENRLWGAVATLQAFIVHNGVV